MSRNVEPEEAEALQEPLEGAAPAAGGAVVGRDFRRPMRLSAARLGALREAVQSGLARVDDLVRRFLGEEAACDVDEVSEENADEVLSKLRPPYAAGRFVVNGQPAWIVWRTAPALAAIGCLLGEERAEDEAERALSHVERRILRDFFAGVTDAVVGALGVSTDSLTLVREPYELGGWREGEPAGADSHRLCVALALEGPIPRSSLRLYLPGFQPAARAHARGRVASAPLPAHLSPVDVRVRVVLGRCEIPLSDLMSLEEGDVVPLDTAPGHVALAVEDRPCARGRLGRRGGRFALRIEEVLNPPLPGEETP